MSQKRTTYTLAYKLSIVRRIDEEGNLDKIARETKINRRCLQRWRANKNTMLQQAQTKKGARSYRLIGASGVTGRPAQYPQVEADLTEWVLEQRRKRLVLLLTFNLLPLLFFLSNDEYRLWYATTIETSGQIEDCGVEAGEFLTWVTCLWGPSAMESVSVMFVFALIVRRDTTWLTNLKLSD